MLIAFIWLAISIPIGLRLRPTLPDFTQFYLGGTIASRGDWDGLYPIPNPYSLDNPGLSFHSYQKPQWQAIRQKRGVPDDTHFILPPPSALIFAPLSKASYRGAYWIWIAISILCTWGVGLCAARLYRDLVKRPSYVEGLIMMLVAFSPMTARAIRIANVSPMIALSIGCALLALLRPSNWRIGMGGAMALAMGALLKYATLVLSPLLLAMRKWRMLAALTILGLVSLVVTVRLAGVDIFVEFVSIILPKLSYPSFFQGNQSVAGLLVRTYGRPLPDNIATALTVARGISLAIVVLAIFSLRKKDWEKHMNVLAAAALLLSWLLIFSPIAWEHWPIFLCPLWGWLIWEAQQGGVRKVVAITSLVLMTIPAGIFQVPGFFVTRFRASEPFNSWQLYGVFLTFLLALSRLDQNGENESENENAAVEPAT
jgi:hypothetical protein